NMRSTQTDSTPSSERKPLHSSLDELLPSQPMTQAPIGEIVAFKLGDNSISLGKLLSELKTLWRTTEPKGTFGGSVRQYGKSLRIVVNFHGELENDSKPYEIKGEQDAARQVWKEDGQLYRKPAPQKMYWSADLKISPEKNLGEMGNLLKELAFKIYHDIEDT